MSAEPPIGNLSRYQQIDDWIFEVKTVRALKVSEFGKPYTATANITLNGDNGYIDSLMMRDEAEFSKEDYQAFVKISQQLGLKKVNFDRFKQQRRTTTTIKVPPLCLEKPELQLVKA